MGGLSSLFNPIGAFLGSALGDFGKFIHDIHTGLLWDIIPGVSDFIFDSIIEPIAYFLGFSDETIYKTSLVAVKIFDDNLYERTQLRLATEYMKHESKDALWYATNFSSTGDTQFGKYYRFGKWYYVDYLPSIQITSTSVKESDTLAILKKIAGDDVFITDIGVMVPPDIDWCKWLLQEQYGYDVGNDYLVIDNKYYTLGNVAYNANTGKYDVTLSAIPVLKTRVYEITEASVSGTATVTTNTYKHTEIEHIDNQVKITEYTSTDYAYNEDILQTEETSKHVHYSDDLALTDGSTKELVSVTERECDIQRKVIANTTVISNKDTSIIMSETTEIISDTETIVLTGSGETYTTDILLSTTETDTGWSNTSVTLPFHNNIRRYLVRYSSRETGKKYLFIYNTLEGTYPALANPVQQVQGLEGYPICMLRNGFCDINQYNSSGQYGHSKPSTISKKRYESTKRLLDAINIDVDELIKGYSGNPDIEHLQDCFYLYGVSPSDDHWVISRVLYEMFDFLYDKFPYSGTDSGCSAAFKENPYNAAIMWTSKPTVIKAEKIGSLGKCTHSVITVTITTVTKTTQVVSYVSSNRELDNDFRRKVVTTEETTVTSSYDGVLSHTVSTTTSYITTYDGNNYDEYGNFQYQMGTTTTTSTKSASCKDLIIKKQITPTTTKTLRLHNTSTFSIISGTFDGYKGGERLDISDKNLVIPLPVAVVGRLTLMEKTALLGRSSYLIFYAFQVQRIKWYQTEAFGAFLNTIITAIAIVIAVVVTVVTVGQAYAGAGAAAAVEAFFMGLLKSALIAGALQLAIYVINETVQDSTLKAALTIAATVAAMAVGGAFNSFDFATVLTLAELPVQAATIYMNDQQQKMANQLQSDISSFNTEYEARSKRYSETIKGFGVGLDVSSAVELATDSSDDFLSNSDRGFMLSPDQFYSLATTACYNYDSLYTGFYDACVHRYCRDRKTLGILNNDEE